MFDVEFHSFFNYGPSKTKTFVGSIVCSLHKIFVLQWRRVYCVATRVTDDCVVFLFVRLRFPRRLHVLHRVCSGRCFLRTVFVFFRRLVRRSRLRVKCRFLPCLVVEIQWWSYVFVLGLTPHLRDVMLHRRSYLCIFSLLSLSMPPSLTSVSDFSV